MFFKQNTNSTQLKHFNILISFFFIDKTRKIILFLVCYLFYCLIFFNELSKI